MNGSAELDLKPARAKSSKPQGLVLERAVEHLLGLQRADGGWEGEMVWNTMILSQYVIVMKAVGKKLPYDVRAQMVQHYRATRTAEGGWGMHGESGPYVFFTTLAYVALRLLGVAADDELCKRARTWLGAQRGGILAIPTWGKFWLGICGLYGYEGINPFSPELFLLPDWVPMSPSNFYCHTRYIYLGIAYLYGARFQANLGDIVTELRRELYDELCAQPYASIDFSRHRHDLAETDLYVAPTPALRAAYDFLYGYERNPSRWLRRRALHHCLDRIVYEQRASRYQGLSPVNALLNCLALYAHSPRHPELTKSLSGIESWRWSDEAEGLRYCGARSNTWDTALAMQSLGAAPAAVRSQPEVRQALASGHRHLCALQMQEELDGWQQEHRQQIRGGWCFSDGQHRWPVSDCTAEALVALMRAEELCADAIREPLSRERIEAATRFLLDRQNADGGFGTYERRRGAAFLEGLNPSEMYGSCMTERSYLECTASSLRGLAAVRARHASNLSQALNQAMELAIERGAARLWKAQREDGSFPGFWGINFTYAIFHIVKAMRAVGVPASDPRLQRAGAWLLSKQRADGGWGEHYSSCLSETYVEHSESQVVMTSWALLALNELEPDAAPDAQLARAIDRGAAFLATQQQPDGGFPQQAQNGVFFGTAMLDYRLYKSYFPVWALGKCAQPRSIA